MAIKVGVPIEQLDTLASLVAPSVAEKVLNGYCDKRIRRYPEALHHRSVQNVFVAIAQEMKCLGEADCELLDEMRAALEDDRPEGFTPKNTELIQQVLTPGVWDLVLNLPFAMMEEARRQQQHSPVRAAVTAQLAVAIAIMGNVPVRIKNLTEVRIGFNLSKPGGSKSPYWRLPRLRCQEPHQAPISAGGPYQLADRRVCA